MANHKQSTYVSDSHRTISATQRTVQETKERIRLTGAILHASVNRLQETEARKLSSDVIGATKTGVT